MARPSQTTINCPSCGQPFPAFIEQILDTRADPSVKERLISGRVNQIACPACGYRGMIGTPLLYHDHEKQLAIIFAPMELNIPERERERIIGMMTQAVMKSLPDEAPRGYLLQPRSTLTFQGLIDQVLEADGITPEVIANERRKAELISQLLEMESDQQDDVITANADLIDETFFEMIAIFSQQSTAGGDSRMSLRLLNLRKKLMEKTPFGLELQEREKAAMEAATALQELKENLTRDSFVDLIVNMSDDPYKVEALGIMGAGILDYQTFEILTSTIERERDAKKKNQLEDAREKLLKISADMEKQTQTIFQNAVETLKMILSSPNIQEAVRGNLTRIDDAFLQVLAANLDEARRMGNIEVSRRLGLIEEEVMALIKESAPPEIQFLNDLFSQTSDDESLALLSSRRDEIDEKFISLLDELSHQLSESGNQAALSRLEKIRQALSI